MLPHMFHHVSCWVPDMFALKKHIDKAAFLLHIQYPERVWPQDLQGPGLKLKLQAISDFTSGGEGLGGCRPLGTVWEDLYLYMVVSWNMGIRQIIHFNGIFPHKPSIWGYPLLWKAPYEQLIDINIEWYTPYFPCPSNSGRTMWKATHWESLPIPHVIYENSSSLPANHAQLPEVRH